jgi:Rieske 2Fe-2S family protein
LVENNQRGVNSLGFVPGPFSEQSESLALRFTDWYVNRVRDLLPRPSAQIHTLRQAG